MRALEQLITVLQSKNHRVTKSRVAVAKALIDNINTPLSAEELFHEIQQQNDSQCDLTSVYRTLSTYEQLNLVRRNVFQGDAARFILTLFDTDEGASHQHYFKCVACNAIEAFDDCILSKKERELERHGYKNLTHHIEITGICPECA